MGTGLGIRSINITVAHNGYVCEVEGQIVGQTMVFNDAAAMLEWLRDQTAERPAHEVLRDAPPQEEMTRILNVDADMAKERDSEHAPRMQLDDYGLTEQGYVRQR